jgi:hypothetical protein
MTGSGSFCFSVSGFGLQARNKEEISKTDAINLIIIINLCLISKNQNQINCHIQSGQSIKTNPAQRVAEPDLSFKYD